MSSKTQLSFPLILTNYKIILLTYLYVIMTHIQIFPEGKNKNSLFMTIAGMYVSKINKLTVREMNTIQNLNKIKNYFFLLLYSRINTYYTTILQTIFQIVQ